MVSIEVLPAGFKKPISFAEALTYEVGDAAGQVDAMARTLGNLIDRLHAKGLLSEEEVMEFLPSHYEVYRE